MSTAEQLYLRALRLLNDNRRHEAGAVFWARCQVSPELRPTRADDLQRAGFTLREISLGSK